MYGNYIPQAALLDAVRMYRRVLDGEDGESVRKELYPNIQNYQFQMDIMDRRRSDKVMMKNLNY